MKPLSGEYGFLTEFSEVTEEDARIRVRHMVDLFQVREFQFYDAMRGYSAPPSKDLDSWHCKAFGRPIKRSVLKAYVDEIRRCGGRSWLYLQAAATDPGDVEMQEGFTVTGQHVVDGRPLLDAVAPNSEWAMKIVPMWAEFAADMGFAGIHWDTLGKFSPTMAQFTDLPGFLRTAKPLMLIRGLEQTANFVDGFGWDPELVDDGAPNGRTISFAYWETWTLPDQEDFFYNQVAPAPSGGGVFVCYPGKTESHEGEWQNQAYVGIWPLDLMIQRWVKARSSGNAYLAVGDGVRHIETQYFPANAPISDGDVSKIRMEVFGLETVKLDFAAKPRNKAVKESTTAQPNTTVWSWKEPTTASTSHRSFADWQQEEAASTAAPTPPPTQRTTTTTTQAPGTTTTEEPGAPCGKPTEGDDCDVAVAWAMEHGIWEHKEWYAGISPQGTYEDFQNDLFVKKLNNCLRPCGAEYKVESGKAASTAVPTPVPTPAPSPAPSLAPVAQEPWQTPAPPPTPASRPKVDRDDQAPIDPWICQADLDNWAIQTQWPPEKQAWCCEHKQLGCFEMPSLPSTRASRTEPSMGDDDDDGGNDIGSQASWPAQGILQMQPSQAPHSFNQVGAFSTDTRDGKKISVRSSSGYSWPIQAIFSGSVLVSFAAIIWVVLGAVVRLAPRAMQAVSRGSSRRPRAGQLAAAEGQLEEERGLVE